MFPDKFLNLFVATDFLNVPLFQNSFSEYEQQNKKPQTKHFSNANSIPSFQFHGFPGGALLKNPPANSGDSRGAGWIPGSGRHPGIGNGNPLQYFRLENSMGRGAWWATVHQGTRSLTQWVHGAHTLFQFSTFCCINLAFTKGFRGLYMQQSVKEAVPVLFQQVFTLSKGLSGRFDSDRNYSFIVRIKMISFKEQILSSF